MTVSLTTLTGPIYMPDGATPVGGRVSFELSSWDREEGEALIVSGPVYSDIDENGQFSVQLFSTTSGENSVHYNMYVLWEDSTFSQTYVNGAYISSPAPNYTKRYIGAFALAGAGPFRISDLNIVSELESNSFDVLLECQAYLASTQDARNTAVAASILATEQAALAVAAASEHLGTFESRMAVEAATLPSAQQRLFVWHNSLLLAYDRATSGSALVSSDGAIWMPSAQYTAYLQHWGITTYSSEAAALAAGLAMTSGDRLAQQTALAAAFGETQGELSIHGFVEAFDLIAINSARVVKLNRGPDFDGICVSSRFNLASACIFQGGTTVSGGCIVEGLNILCDQAPAMASGLRSDLIQYPSAFDCAGDFGALHFLRIQRAYTAFRAVREDSANNGGWRVGRIEYSSFSEGVKIGTATKGPLHFFTVADLDAWPYGFAGNANLLSIYYDGTGRQAYFGRCDNLTVDRMGIFRGGRIEIEAGNGLPVQIDKLALDGDGAELRLISGKSIIGSIYGTEATTSPQLDFKIKCSGGQHTISACDLVGDSTPLVEVTGGELTVTGRLYNTNLTIGQGATVSAGHLRLVNCIFDAPAGTPLVPFVEQSGTGILEVLGCRATIGGSAVAVATVIKFNTAVTGNRLDDTPHTIADFAALIAKGFVPEDGRTYILDGVVFRGKTGATIFPSLPGMTHGVDGVSPDHFGGKLRAHIEAAWAYFASVGATGIAVDLPATTSVPFIFIGGRYNTDSTSALVLETTGSGQIIEFRGNALAQHLSIVVRRKNVEIVRPYLIGGTYDMDDGILFEPPSGEGFRGGFIRNPRIFNICNAAKTAASIRTRGNAAHIQVSDAWLQGSDYNYVAEAVDAGDSVGGMLFSGLHAMNARVNNIRLTSGGENRFVNYRVRGAAQEGVLITGNTDRKALEQYFGNGGITGNHTDLTTRASNPITTITDEGGFAKVTITGSHMFWAGLRSCRIQGTGISAYDDTTNVRCIEVGADYVVTNVAYAGDATGSLVHCGFDVKLQSESILGHVNDIMFNGANINSLGLFGAYNISFFGCRLKVNAWASGCNAILRVGGFRGREGDPAWDDVPFVGQVDGIYEQGLSVPEGSDRYTIATMKMRTPRTSDGLSGNKPVAYNSVGVHPVDGVVIEGTAIISSPATALDETAGRALRVGDFGLAVSGQDLAPDVSGAKNARAVARARKDARRRATLQNWRFGATAWEPISGLGAKLVAWWDVDTYATLMTDDGGGLISSWTDRVLGRALTATGAARPTYQAAGLYGRPCVSFDGVANVLSTSTLTGLPTGSAAGGLVAVTGPWVAAATTHAVGYGSTGANAARRLSTNTGGLVNSSNGTTAQTGTTANVALNVLIGEWNVTTASLHQNGVTSNDSPEAVTMNTTTSYFRVGASLVATPSQFTAIQITDIMVINGILTAYERKKLEGFLAWKRAGGQALRNTHPHYDYAPLAGSRPKSARPYKFVTTNNQRMSGATAAVGPNTGFKGRIVELIGGDDCSEIRVGFSNWYIDNQSTSAAETDNTDAVTLSKVAMVYDGISVPVTFNSGSRSVVLAAGETLKLSDIVEASSFGFDRFKAGTVLELRYTGTLASSSSVMLYNERGANEFASTIKEQAFHYPAADAVDDVDALGNMATPANNIGNLIIGPTAIIGRYDGAPPVIDVFADSIPHGLKDFVSGGISSNGVGGATGAVNGGGWVRRALMSLGLSYSLTSKVGHRYQHMAANYTKRATFFPYSTHALFTLGTNDLNADITAADILTSATPIWAAYRAAGGQGVYHATIVPRVAENSYYGTDLENQSPGAPYVSGGERDKLNTTLQNQAPGLLNAIVDVSRAVSDPRDPSRWAVPDFTSTLSGAVTSATTTLPMTSVPEVELCIVLEPGTGNAEPTAFNVLSVAGNTAVFSAAPTSLSHDAGAVVKATLALDGTHPSAQAHHLMSLVAMPVLGEIEDVA